MTETGKITLQALQGDWFNDQGETMTVLNDVCTLNSSRKSYQIFEYEHHFRLLECILPKHSPSITWLRENREITWTRKESGTWYRVLQHTIVRDNVDFKSKNLKILTAGCHVLAKEQRGRQVRISKPINGWCSLKSLKTCCPNPKDRSSMITSSPKGGSSYPSSSNSRVPNGWYTTSYADGNSIDSHSSAFSVHGARTNGRRKKFGFRSKQRKIEKTRSEIKNHFERKGLFAEEGELVRGSDTVRVHVKTFEGLNKIQNALRDVENSPDCEITRIACPFSKKNKFQKKGYILYLKVADKSQVPAVLEIFEKYEDSLKNCVIAIPKEEQLGSRDGKKKNSENEDDDEEEMLDEDLEEENENSFCGDEFGGNNGGANSYSLPNLPRLMAFNNNNNKSTPSSPNRMRLNSNGSNHSNSSGMRLNSSGSNHSNSSGRGNKETNSNGNNNNLNNNNKPQKHHSFDLTLKRDPARMREVQQPRNHSPNLIRSQHKLSLDSAINRNGMLRSNSFDNMGHGGMGEKHDSFDSMGEMHHTSNYRKHHPFDSRRDTRKQHRHGHPHTHSASFEDTRSSNGSINTNPHRHSLDHIGGPGRKPHRSFDDANGRHNNRGRKHYHSFDDANDRNNNPLDNRGRKHHHSFDDVRDTNTGGNNAGFNSGGRKHHHSFEDFETSMGRKHHHSFDSAHSFESNRKHQHYDFDETSGNGRHHSFEGFGRKHHHSFDDVNGVGGRHHSFDGFERKHHHSYDEMSGKFQSYNSMGSTKHDSFDDLPRSHPASFDASARNSSFDSVLHSFDSTMDGSHKRSYDGSSKYSIDSEKYSYDENFGGSNHSASSPLRPTYQRCDNYPLPMQQQPPMTQRDAPNWWQSLPKEPQDVIKMMLHGRSYGQDVVQIFMEYTKLREAECRNFLQWWFNLKQTDIDETDGPFDLERVFDINNIKLGCHYEDMPQRRSRVPPVQDMDQDPISNDCFQLIERSMERTANQSPQQQPQQNNNNNNNNNNNSSNDNNSNSNDNNSHKNSHHRQGKQHRRFHRSEYDSRPISTRRERQRRTGGQRHPQRQQHQRQHSQQHQHKHQQQSQQQQRAPEYQSRFSSFNKHLNGRSGNHNSQHHSMSPTNQQNTHSRYYDLFGRDQRKK